MQDFTEFVREIAGSHISQSPVAAALATLVFFGVTWVLHAVPYAAFTKITVGKWQNGFLIAALPPVTYTMFFFLIAWNSVTTGGASPARALGEGGFVGHAVSVVQVFLFVALVLLPPFAPTYFFGKAIAKFRNAPEELKVAHTNSLTSAGLVALPVLSPIICAVVSFLLWRYPTFFKLKSSLRSGRQLSSIDYEPWDRKAVSCENLPPYPFEFGSPLSRDWRQSGECSRSSASSYFFWETRTRSVSR